MADDSPRLPGGRQPPPWRGLALVILRQKVLLISRLRARQTHHRTPQVYKDRGVHLKEAVAQKHRKRKKKEEKKRKKKEKEKQKEKVITSVPATLGSETD